MADPLNNGIDTDFCKINFCSLFLEFYKNTNKLNLETINLLLWCVFNFLINENLLKEEVYKIIISFKKYYRSIKFLK